jgi:hypothetical protein
LLTAARILLTLTVLGYSLGTLKADFNKTHATNPAWTGHARFHVVWQILSYSGVGVIALYLIWAGGIERLYLAAALSVAIYGAFFTTVFARPLYQAHWRWDVNVTVFTILSALLFAAVVALLAG